MAMITDPDDFFSKGCGRCERFATPDCSARQWIDGLNSLRRICLAMGLAETVKWAHPSYMHADRNIALFGAFRGDFRLSFMNPGLLDDTEGVLEPQGPNSRTPGVIRFTDVKQVGEREPVIRAYLKQLMDHAEAGTKPPKVQTGVEMPEELAEALEADPELAEAFHLLTPGRQRSYLFNLNQARQLKTRIARIGKFREKIIAGKGAMER
jgi:uncharacterized protein YdeI (YjbR/CyaY-like superfamily)